MAKMSGVKRLTASTNFSAGMSIPRSMTSKPDADANAIT